MLTKHVTRRLPIPGEDGHWVELRRLSWTQLDQARTARQQRGLTMLAEQTEDIRAIISNAQARQQVVQAAAMDPLADYDLATLLELGVAGWSYDEPVTPENLADLDADTAHWAALEIVKPTQRTEEERDARLFRVTSSAG